MHVACLRARRRLAVRLTPWLSATRCRSAFPPCFTRHPVRRIAELERPHHMTVSSNVIRYQTISKFSIESGYTEWAIRGKIRDGVWLEGRVWVKAPDGRILISIEGYNLWAEAGLASA